MHQGYNQTKLIFGGLTVYAANLFSSPTAKCRDLVLDDSQTVIVDSRDPATVGTVATFSCPSGLILTGPNSTTCMGNGEWETDPREIKCKGHSILSVHVSCHI